VDRVVPTASSLLLEHQRAKHLVDDFLSESSKEQAIWSEITSPS
jgi:hypothetical protein